MKIRSSLTEGANSNRQTRGHSPSRRLVTLVIGLVMVLLLMQQAGDPAVYRRLFNRLGIPMTDADGQPVVTVPEELPVQLLEESSPECSPVVAKMSSEGRRDVTELLAAIRCGRVDELISDSQDRIEYCLNAATQCEFAAFEELKRELIQATSQGNAIEFDGFPNLKGLQDALDRTYLESIEDGTVWNAGDFFAFYRSLERIRSAENLSDMPVYVGAVPLIEQSVVYRGKHIKLSGEAVQAKRFEAQQNPFGINEYWMVWLRPLDGSERPVVVYAPEVDERIKALPEEGASEESLEVEVEGLFHKRYLYRSVGGYDQAPLIVGRLRLPELKANSTAGESNAGTSLLWVWGAAALFGIAITGLVLLTSQKASKRQRELRSRGIRPSENLLDELDV